MNNRICHKSEDDCYSTKFHICEYWKCNFDNGWHSSYFESSCINSDTIYSKERLERDLYKVLEDL